MFLIFSGSVFYSGLRYKKYFRIKAIDGALFITTVFVSLPVLDSHSGIGENSQPIGGFPPILKKKQGKNWLKEKKKMATRPPKIGGRVGAAGSCLC